MANILTVGVFCGSQSGHDQSWSQAAAALGRSLAQAGYRLIYGGGKTGLMGVIADAALAGGSTVIGVMPQFLNQTKWVHDGIDEMILTSSIHERKKQIYERADACVILPGGLGTLDEGIEVLTWKSLGLHKKPVILANVNNFWKPMIELLTHCQRAQFLYQQLDELVHISPHIDAVVPDIQRLCGAKQPS